MWKGTAFPVTPAARKPPWVCTLGPWYWNRGCLLAQAGHRGDVLFLKVTH